MRGGALTRIVAIVAFLAAGCTAEQPTPVVESVAPNWGYNGEDSDIVITGRDFYPGVQASGADELSWDSQFRVWLIGDERTELDDVTLVDYQHLAANVPQGLEPGLHAIEIESPTGTTASRADVFTVTDTRADHLLVEPDTDSQAVNTPALIHVSLLDPNDRLVADDLDVDVEIEVEDGDPSGLSFSSTTRLDQQAELEEGLGITGRLEPTGEGWFALTSTTPVTLSVRVSPSEADSVVSVDAAPLEFTAGEVAGVRISLPTMVSTAAGSSFTVSLTLVDADGNPTSLVEAAMLLYESCPGGTYQEAVTFIDKLSDQRVEVTRATNEDCAANSIAAVGIAGGVEIEGSSELFEVVPGPPSTLDVFASPDEVAAGSAELSVWVEVRDDYGNAVDDHLGGTPVLTDSAGGLDPDGQGQQSCSPFTAELSRSWCTVALWKTGADITLTAADDLGLTGVSNPITVLPGELADVEASVDGNDVVAGEEFEVTLVGIDAHDNAIDVDFASAGKLSFQDGSGPIECTENMFSSPAIGTTYDCVITQALDADTITVYLEVDGEAMSAATEPFDVVNAALETVTIDLGGVSSVTAGDVMLVTITGYDAYDNPYIIGTDHTVDLDDDGGSVAVTTGGDSVELDADGQAEVSLVFTRAREGDRLHVSQSGTLLGSSTSFDVVHGSLDSFDIAPERTWAWLDDPLAVTITAVDAWDNPVTSFANAVTLRSPSSLGDDVSVTDWTDGVADAAFEFDTAGLEESLRVYYVGLLAGEASAVDALDPSCTNGPRADLLIAGDDTATLCLSGGTTPTTTISAAESDAGGASLVTWHWDVGDGEWYRSADESLDMEWTEEGGWRVSVVVADSNACGDTASAEVYVAEADGRPAGPVTIELDDTTLTTGSESALAEITATDCAGDPANGDIYAWVNLGDLTDGVSSSLTTSGEGLSVTLVGGVGDLKWTVVDELHDGDGVLRAGALSGAAFGSATATISGDSALPTIWSVSPYGSTATPFSDIVVQFSEPMLSRSVAVGSFSLTDSAGIVQTISGVTLSPSGKVATLELASEAGRGIWVLTATDDLRDDSGNKLDGDWTLASGDFSFTFGDVVATRADVSECEATPSLFRPDGDDGADEEADEVALALSASGLPTWWLLEVMDSDGSTVYKTRLTPSGSSRDPHSWDGRAQDGSIVDNGVYTVRVSAEDAALNTGDACSVEVTVDNRVVGIAE